MNTKFLTLIALLMIVMVWSCDEKQTIDPEGTGMPEFHYVKIKQKTIRVAVGKSDSIVPVFDSEETAAMTFHWEVLDTELAAIESALDSIGAVTNIGVVTGLAPGNTVIKIESEDGKLKYFTDLVVRQ